jgi:hypothetical protein
MLPPLRPVRRAAHNWESEAGLSGECSDDDGKPALRLTARGAQMGRALAITGEDADAVLPALPESQG